MKPVVTRLYAVLVALTFVGLIAWAGADWYQRQELAQDQGRAALRQAAGWISDLTVRRTPLDAPVLSRVFASALANGRWKMVVLSSAERGTEFYKGPRPAVPVDKAVPRWEPKPLSEVKIALPVFRATGDPLVLEGITEFYGPLEIFGLLKACGLTLVVLLVLTTLVVMLSARQEDEPAFEPAGRVPDLETEPVDDPLQDEGEGESLGHLADPVTDREEEYWFDDSLTLEDLPPLETHAPEPAPESSAEPARPVAAEPAVSGPSLFSPHSGLGWESFLAARLTSELDRASSQNQDLALVLLSVKNGSVAPAAWGDAVREAFPLRDLDFECEGGAAVLLPARSLEQGLKAARAFVESADRSLSGAVVHAGVAARSGRLISAETLLAEAASARRRSLAGTVRVLGLKTDPDRYRDFLASASA